MDLLAVIDQPLASAVGVRLAHELMHISGHPALENAPRPVELIVFLRTDLTAAAYPARCEFIYGEWLRSEFETEKMPKPGRDPELTLVPAQARQEAKTLLGPPADKIPPVIPQKDIRRAIADVLPSLPATLETDSRNVLLALARMWRTLTAGEFVSKNVAAEWAADRLPVEQALALNVAREAYSGLRKDNWRRLQKELRRIRFIGRTCGGKLIAFTSPP